MKYFFNTITKPYIKQNNYKQILEIGASKGQNSECLLSLGLTNLTIIDPCIDCDLQMKFQSDVNVIVLKGLSLDILPMLSGSYDCIFIDGDHNWYTVFKELSIIEEKKLLVVGGTIFIHDVGWPYGRRDMYYFPESIPKEYTHSYALKGMVKGQSELIDGKGVNFTLYNAKTEYGSRNGVLTAVEDFIKVNPQYAFLFDKRQYGLGILIKVKELISYKLKFYWQIRIIFFRILDLLNHSED